MREAVFGFSGDPSPSVNTRPWSCHSSPAASRSAAWRALWAFKAARVSTSRDRVRRDVAVFGSSKRGWPSTSKSHLLIGLGIAACEQGRRVHYTTCAQLVNELVEAADDRKLSRLVARYGWLDLLCLDELGYVQLDPRGAELLFQIITEREEKASIATASNLPFSEWGSVISDPRLVAAIVDRLTFHAHIIQTGTDSYRLRTTKASRRSR